MDPLKFALLALPYFLLFSLFFSRISVNALNLGINPNDSPFHQLDKECSRTCESEFCTVPPFMRYGKYCGLLYSGCPGEQPCDGLDNCCMNHDHCIQSKNNDYLDKECSQQLLNCLDNFERSGGQTFTGSKCQATEVTHLIKLVMEAALFAGNFLAPKPN